MATLYSIRIDHGDGTFSYYADTLGRTGFIKKLALLIISEQAVKGLSCDLVRN